MMPKFKKRVPSGKVFIIEKREKSGAARCGNCGKSLHGVPRLQPSELNKLAKTEKRPERPFGGFYCSACSREILREKARGMV